MKDIPILHPDDFKNMPWKNGGGTTTELARIPHPHDPEKFLFRLSKAKIEKSGPFSHFENMDRIILLLSGKGMDLTFNDGLFAVLETPLSAITFSGDENIHCDLVSGSCTDFNIMVDRDFGKAHIEVIHLKANQKFHMAKFKHSYLYQFIGKVSWNKHIILPDSLWVLKSIPLLEFEALEKTDLILIHLEQK